MATPKIQTGFNLIELLIVLSIIAILSTLSFPLYTEHLMRERRLEAETTLYKLAAALEQYFIVNNTYQNATLEALGFSSLVADNHYQLAIEIADNHHYVLSITPRENQNDHCGVLRLNSQGEKTSNCL